MIEMAVIKELPSRKKKKKKRNKILDDNNMEWLSEFKTKVSELASDGLLSGASIDCIVKAKT